MWGGYQGPYLPQFQAPLYQQPPSSPSSPPPADIPALPTIKSKKKRFVAPSSSPAVRKSSPIDAEVDDSVLISDFFKWLAKKTPNNRHQNLIRIYNVINEQEWTIDDLKAMADSSSIPYRVAIEKGIPDGAARRFKAELALFRPHYRAAKALLAVAQSGNDTDDSSRSSGDEDGVEDEKEEKEEKEE